MRQSLYGGAASEGKRPLAEHRIFDQRQPGEGVRNAVILCSQRQCSIARNGYEGGVGKCPNAVAEPVKQQRIEIADVSRAKQRTNLATAVARDSIAYRPALCDEEQT